MSEVADRIERSMGAYDSLPDRWEDLTPPLLEEVSIIWPIVTLTSSHLSISVTHDVLRMVTFDPDPARGGLIRYITPQHVWSFTVHHGVRGVQPHPPTPTLTCPECSWQWGAAVLPQTRQNSVSP